MTSPATTVQTAALTALAGVGTFARTTRERATLVANGATMPLILLYPHREKTSYTTKEHITSTMEVYFCDVVPGPGDSNPDYFATSDNLFTLKNKLLAALYDMPLTAVGSDTIPADQHEGSFEAQLAVVGITVSFTQNRAC